MAALSIALTPFESISIGKEQEQQQEQRTAIVRRSSRFSPSRLILFGAALFALTLPVTGQITPHSTTSIGDDSEPCACEPYIIGTSPENQCVCPHDIMLPGHVSLAMVMASRRELCAGKTQGRHCTRDKRICHDCGRSSRDDDDDDNDND